MFSATLCKGVQAVKNRKCEKCGAPTVEGLPLCPACMKESGAAAEIVKAIRPARKIAVYRTGDVVRVEVEGAGRGDIPAAVKAAKERGMEDAE